MSTRIVSVLLAAITIGLASFFIFDNNQVSNSQHVAPVSSNMNIQNQPTTPVVNDPAAIDNPMPSTATRQDSTSDPNPFLAPQRVNGTLVGSSDTVQVR